MGNIIILDYTTKEPLEMIGRCAGVCWGTNLANTEKNIKRALECMDSGHMRTAEFPDIYMIIDRYSARVLRELYTHIGGAPTRLQASTRYIDYEHGFDYIIPRTIKDNIEAANTYIEAMNNIQKALKTLDGMGIPREDSANLLPLGMESKMIYKINLRTLIDMSHQRKCNRAYWEFRNLFKDIEISLSDYSPQWAEIVNKYFKPKCELYGYCTESRSCGKYPKREH